MKKKIMNEEIGLQVIHLPRPINPAVQKILENQ